MTIFKYKNSIKFGSERMIISNQISSLGLSVPDAYAKRVSEYDAEYDGEPFPAPSMVMLTEINIKNTILLTD